MIHFIIGTKAQFVKMAPLMFLLEQEQTPYRLLDLGQHAALTGAILNDFGIHPAVSHVSTARGNVENYRQALPWLLACARLILSKRKRLLERHFNGASGGVLIHGDTASTLLGLYLGKRAGLRVGLVEAGLSSHRLFDPFPEEIIRRHAEHRADFLFAPDSVAESRLRAMDLRGAICNTLYNTGLDAVSLIIQRHNLMAAPPDAGTYSILTLHRLETLTSGRKLRRAIQHAIRLAGYMGPVRFFLHGPTRLALERQRLMEMLNDNPAFTLAPLLPYPEFIRQILHCRYLLTDGGSIQEEAAYLHVPCLILRSRTERQHGLGNNARLATFDVKSDCDFLKAADNGRNGFHHNHDLAASRRIMDFMKHAVSC